MTKDFPFTEKILWEQFYDYKKIHCPIDVKSYEKLLKRYKYDVGEMEYLVQGFRNGFSIEYDGPRNIVRNSNNLKLRVGSKVQLWNKVMKEVKEKRTAGPFKESNFPLKFYQQSPLGLVPKQNTGGQEGQILNNNPTEEPTQDVRLIFHLSHPEGESINDYIDPEKCKVKYHDLDEAVKKSYELLKEGAKKVVYASCDLKSAFRNC